MLFNSIEFILFLPLVFFIYWKVVHKNLNLQNLFLLIASYVFYGWWDYRFLALIVLSSMVDFWVGQKIDRALDQQQRKKWLIVSLCTNLGVLGLFKYYNFFLDSLVQALGSLEISLSIPTLQIILPVGISFYTFQTLSYTIDIYRRQLEPCKDPITFFAFVSFFPQLVAGPIERASQLLPQFQKGRQFEFSQARKGLELILWGTFKKVVIADRLAQYVDLVYADPGNFTGISVLLATFFFTFQIYCDFSGYSDIAIGTARLFGFELMVNFRTPYFSANLKEFWSRWHISLSTWFRDYVYIPLGGNRAGTSRWLGNFLITFLVSGLWHGANWTFVIWGFIHGFVTAVEAVLVKFTRLPRLPRKLGQLFTFGIVSLAWIFFRAESASDAFFILGQIPENLLQHLSSYAELEMALRSFIASRTEFTYTLLSFGLFFILEWFMGRKDFADFAGRIGKYRRWFLYYLLASWILYFGAFNQSAQFIYFQF